MTALGDVLQLVSGIGPDAGGWYTALCPFHDDRHRPNLRFRATGFVCMACAAKGNLNELIAKLRPAPSDRWSGRIAAVYDYVDEERRLLFQVVRLCNPRDFKQRRPDGNGGWIWNLKGVRRVLYRLPQLVAADAAELVFVVEGEKDADTLARLGLVATTNPGGAGKWRPEYNRYLNGRRVVILSDNDDAGERHAELVARCLVG